jgi:hypothetical protein
MATQIINGTYYNTDDIQALCEKVCEKLGYSERIFRVAYLGKTTPYHEDVDRWSRGYQFSLEAKGWGALLEEGESPMASSSAARGRDASWYERVISIPRRNGLLGTEELQKVAASQLEEVPELVRKHLVFAICSQHNETYSFEAVWDSVSSMPIRVMAKSDAKGKVKARINKLEQSLKEATRELRWAESYLRQAQEEVRTWAETVPLREARVAEIKAEIESLKEKLPPGKRRESPNL